MALSPQLLLLVLLSLGGCADAQVAATTVPTVSRTTTNCAQFGCGRATASCPTTIVNNVESTTCICLPHFDDIDCTDNQHQRLGKKMYALWVVMLLLWGGMAVFAVVLLSSYYKIFAPLTAKSPQRFGIWFCFIAAAARTLNVTVALSIGPRYELLYFQDPSFVQALMRYSFGLFYPLAISAYTLQIFLWAEICHAVGHNQGKTGGGFLPRLKPLFVVACVAVLVFEIVVQAVLTAQPRGTIGGQIVLIYRILLAVTIMALILGGSIFGIRLIGLLKAAPNMSERKKSPKIFLSKLIVLTCAFLFVGLCLSLVLAFSDWESTDNGLYSSTFVSRIVEGSMLLLILFTFSKLLKNQQERNAKGSLESGDTSSTEGRSSSRSGLWKRLTTFSMVKQNPSVGTNLLEEDHLAELSDEDDTLANELNSLRTAIDEVPEDNRGVRWPSNSKLSEYSQ